MAEKRRLPMLGDQGPPEPGELPEERSPAAWVMLGCLAVFAVLVPLAMLGMALLRLVSSAPGPLPLVAVSLVCVALSSFSGGYLVGRFGTTGAHGGAMSGALAGLVMWALSRTGAGAIIVPVTALCAHLGARSGRRARTPGDTVG